MDLRAELTKAVEDGPEDLIVHHAHRAIVRADDDRPSDAVDDPTKRCIETLPVPERPKLTGPYGHEPPGEPSDVMRGATGGVALARAPIHARIVQRQCGG